MGEQGKMKQLNEEDIQEITKLDVTLETEIHARAGAYYEFVKGTYEGMPVIAKKLEPGERIPAQSRENTNRCVVNYLEAVKKEDSVYLLYRPFHKTLEDFLEHDKEVYVPYGGISSARKNQCFRFSDKTRGVVRSVLNTLHYAHKNNRTHNQLEGNIFVMEDVIHEGRKKIRITYYAVLTNDFTQHEQVHKGDATKKKEYKQIEKAKKENWKAVGKLLKLISGYHSSFKKSQLDFEVYNLIDTLCGADSAKLTNKLAIYSPSLWSTFYRLEFAKWANDARGRMFVFNAKELCKGDWRRDPVIRRLANEIIPKTLPYGGTQEELVRFVRNISEHPTDFKKYKAPPTSRYKDIFDFVRFMFPQYHVNLVRKCIVDNIKEFKRGLELAPPK